MFGPENVSLDRVFDPGAPLQAEEAEVLGGVRGFRMLRIDQRFTSPRGPPMATTSWVFVMFGESHLTGLGAAVKALT